MLYIYLVWQVLSNIFFTWWSFISVFFLSGLVYQIAGRYNILNTWLLTTTYIRFKSSFVLLKSIFCIAYRRYERGKKGDLVNSNKVYCLYQMVYFHWKIKRGPRWSYLQQKNIKELWFMNIDLIRAVASYFIRYIYGFCKGYMYKFMKFSYHGYS